MELTTSRMILREFVFEDWPAVLAYQSNPRYLRYTPWDGRSAADVQAFVQCFVDYQKQEPRAKFQLALTLTLDGRLIGTCGLRKAAADSQRQKSGANWHLSSGGKAMLRKRCGPFSPSASMG